jgi:RNA polymerase sigma-70 factor, ECF subfamily
LNFGLTTHQPGSTITLAEKNLTTFERLFKDLFKPLCGFAIKYTGDLDEAKGLVHDVFVGLWEKLATLPDDTNYRSYLYTGVRNRGLNYIRDRKNQVSFSGVPEEQLASTDDPMVALELEREIEAAIQSLPENAGKSSN